MADMSSSSMNEQQNTGSFRDPSGFVFSANGRIYRRINPCYKETYDALKAERVYDKLIEQGFLVPHKEVYYGEDHIDLEAEKIPFISYPYEWSFSQLKDAALHTLALQKQLVEWGFSLKDASAYNIQFVNGKPIFIDTLSFERFEPNPWIAFGQFLRHFLYPLMLMQMVDLRANQLLRLWIDGIPEDVIYTLLPNRKWLSLNYWLYVKLPYSATQKYSAHRKKVQRTLPKEKMLKLMDALQMAIGGIKPKKAPTEWGNYYATTNYNEHSFDEKTKLVDQFLQTINPKTVWDLGANNGNFSRLASTKGIPTVAFDIDPLAVEKNYLTIKKTQETNLLPLQLDLTNPSGGIGWANQERLALHQRGPADCGLILALIHHLAIGNNVPFGALASYFADLFNAIIIEFIPKEDSKIQEMLLNRKDVFDEYTQEHFERSFESFFSIEAKQAIPGSLRTLYWMKKK